MSETPLPNDSPWMQNDRCFKINQYDFCSFSCLSVAVWESTCCPALQPLPLRGHPSTQHRAHTTILGDPGHWWTQIHSLHLRLREPRHPSGESVFRVAIEVTCSATIVLLSSSSTTCHHCISRGFCSFGTLFSFYSTKTHLALPRKAIHRYAQKL